MKNDATVDQGLKMVGNGMEISRSSIQLCNSFMQANKTWTKAYSESQSQYISHLSRQDVKFVCALFFSSPFLFCL